jgi:hypothetical protein
LGTQDGFHIFTDLQDRVVTAKIINVDDQRGLVELEMENKRRVKVGPSVFIEKDQDYIRNWRLCESFLSSSGLRFEGEKKVVEDWSENSGGINREFEKVVYNCTFRNGSSTEFTDLAVDYCVYWEQEVGGKGGGEERMEKDFSGSFQIGRLAPREAVNLATEPVVLLYQHLAGGYYYLGGQTDKQSSKMKGVWLKVSMKSKSGETVTRDFCEPSDVMKRQTWKAPEKAPSEVAAPSKKKKGKKKQQ